MPGPSSPPQLTGDALESYIRAGATSRGLDPDAVMSVVYGEGGLDGAVGDDGTSFGPIQMHWGGAMPAQYVNNYETSKAFANSTAGVDYALGIIEGVAHGLTGDAAIQAIVTNFERPKNPGPEIANDESRGSSGVSRQAQDPQSGPAGASTYSRPRGGSSTGGILGFLNSIGGGAESIGKDVAGGVEDVGESAWGDTIGQVSSVADALKVMLWLFDPRQWLRMVELVTGLLIISLALRGLALVFLSKSTATVGKVKGALAAGAAEE